MKHSIVGAAVALVAGTVALGVGCSSPPPAAYSFTEVYKQIIQPNVSSAGCTSAFCHYAGVGIRYSALDMSSQVVAYWNLVDQACIGPLCGAMGTRVVPFHPDESIMYLKVSETTPPCGSQMPADVTVLVDTGEAQFSGKPLSTPQLNLLKEWINEGAQNN
jgi:hypothetical protein